MLRSLVSRLAALVVLAGQTQPVVVALLCDTGRLEAACEEMASSPETTVLVLPSQHLVDCATMDGCAVPMPTVGPVHLQPSFAAIEFSGTTLGAPDILASFDTSPIPPPPQA